MREIKFINLKKITDDNVWDIIKLSVSKEQDEFVASNSDSIIEAYVIQPEDGVALPFGIYNDEELIGFVMIDNRYQNKGYGKQAMKVILDYVETMPKGKSEYCWTSYEPENKVAQIGRAHV